MRTRLEERTIPDKPTYLCVELKGREPHHFRIPVMTDLMRIGEYINSTRDDGASEFFVAMMVLVGLAWYHETLDLETARPDRLDVDALAAYSREIQRELEDEGYTPAEMSYMAGVLSKEMAKRNNEAAEAMDLADFGQPPTDGSTTP